MPGFFNPKDYVDVQERITRFWQEYPEGAIRTRLDSDPTDFSTCRYRAEIYKDRTAQFPDATGYAFEIAGGKGANSTSHEENCETSAIGRALANMGYATSGKDRPSRQEMEKAQNAPHAPQAVQQPRSASQPPNPTPDTSQPANIDRERVMKRLHAVGKDHGIDHEGLRALVIARAAKDGVAIGSLQDASGWLLAETANAIESDPAKLKSWVAKQQELMPGIEAVPNVANSPTFN